MKYAFIELILRIYQKRYSKTSVCERVLLSTVEKFFILLWLLGFRSNLTIVFRYKYLLNRFRLNECYELFKSSILEFEQFLGFWPSVLEQPDVLSPKRTAKIAVLVGAEASGSSLGSDVGSDTDIYHGYLSADVHSGALDKCKGVYLNNYKARNNSHVLQDLGLPIFCKDILFDKAKGRSILMVRGAQSVLMDEISILRYSLDLFVRGYERVVLQGFGMYLNGASHNESLQTTRESLMAHDIVLNSWIFMNLVGSGHVCCSELDSMSLENYFSALEGIYGE